VSVIFTPFRQEDYLPYLSVPIDVVIRKVYWRLNNLTGRITGKHDNDIDALAQRLFPDKPIYLDDLWFWGHFTFNKEQMLEEANKAMIYTDKYLSEKEIKQSKVVSKCNKFIGIISNR
jgi:hypothetical protein